MKSTKIFFDSGYYRVELGIEKIKSTGNRPDILVMKYTKKPQIASIRIVGRDVESYDSSQDALIPHSGDVDVMLRCFKRVLKGRKIVPEDAFTRFGCLSGFFKNVQAWYPSKSKLL